MQTRTVGIFLFDDVEVLDFAGPFEVFSRVRLVPGTASRLTSDSAPFEVFTVASRERNITATGGLRVTATHLWLDAPSIDIVVIPGGFGTRALLEDAATARWIQDIAERAEQVTSVCTGALLLAKAGLLTNRQATTHHAAYDLLASLDDSITVRRDQRVVHDGIISSAGVSAGIDMAFDVVENLCGKDVADETADYIEYRRAARQPPKAR